MPEDPIDPSVPPPFTGHDRTLDEQLLDTPGPLLGQLLAGDAARLDAIRVELETGFRTLGGIERGVSIFGSARTPEDDPAYERARRLAAMLGERGFTIITGGGPGIMEAANRGARDVGARSVGLNIELPFEQHLNPYLDLSLNFEHFFARKVMFVRYAQAFVVMPGGFGTLDELFESLTLIQTAKIRHFPVVLVGSSFWSGLHDWAAGQLVASGKITAAELDLLRITDDLDDVVRVIERGFDRQVAAAEARVAVLPGGHEADQPTGGVGLGEAYP